MMIEKKKYLSNKIIRRKLNNLISLDDKRLFQKDFFIKIEKSYIYNLDNHIILPDGRVQSLNYELIKDYLAYKSISNYVLLKKIILSLIHIYKVIFSKFSYKYINNKKEYFIIHNRNSEGFFHWMTDSLPKILFLKNKKNATVVLPKSLKRKFILDSLKKFKISYFFIEDDKKYMFKNLSYIGELYPSGSPRKEIIERLVRGIKKSKYNNNRIYISRNKSNKRKIINEKSVIKILKKYNFKIIYMEKLTLEQQIIIASSSKYILGLHGAGLTNMIWMKPYGTLIELRPEKNQFLNCYFNLSNLLNINYEYILCKKDNIYKSSNESDYYVNVNSMENKIKSILKK
jgi:hypothetical protein